MTHCPWSSASFPLADFLSQNGSDSSLLGMLVKPSDLWLGAGIYNTYLGNTSWLPLQFLKHLLPPSPAWCVLCFSFSISLWLASAQFYSNSPSWEPASCPHQVNLWEDTGLESICECLWMYLCVSGSDFRAPKNKVCHCFHCFPIYFPGSDGTGCHDLRFLNVELEANFFTPSFTFIKRLFNSSSLSAIRVVLSAYLRLLIFLPGNLDSSLCFFQPSISHDVLCI